MIEKQKWLERVPMLSIHPDAASRDDVANLAAELMESRRLLCLVWNHMHGINMDGTKRPFPGDELCGQNWNKLSDAIGLYLEPVEEALTCPKCGEHPDKHVGQWQDCPEKKLL